MGSTCLVERDGMHVIHCKKEVLNSLSDLHSDTCRGRRAGGGRGRWEVVAGLGAKGGQEGEGVPRGEWNPMMLTQRSDFAKQHSSYE